MNISYLELQADIHDLYSLGLEEEEVDGYICFFFDNYQQFSGGLDEQFPN